MKILVAGINGFVGKHLANLLFENGHQVIGLGFGSPEETIKEKHASYFECDLCDQNLVMKLPLSSEINVVINLAGFAKVGVGSEALDDYMRVNTTVHKNLIEKCVADQRNLRYIAISTAAVYSTRGNMPLVESSETQSEDLLPVYARSKLSMEEAVQAYRGSGIEVVVARPSNHIGPGQQPGFLVPDLAEQIINNTDGVLKVGTLETRRDYTDVRDVVKAYELLASTETLSSDLYNICSGKSRSGIQVLSELLKNFKKIDVKTELDPSKVRSNDIMDIYGSAQLLKNDTGWQPSIPFEKTIRDFVNWRLAEID